jgi:hypothetical protein
MNTKPVPHMTADEMEALVRNAVRQELSAAGLRIDEPEHQDEARADFVFLRSLRRGTYGAASKVGMAVILAIVSGIGWLIINGFKAVRGM